MSLRQTRAAWHHLANDLLEVEVGGASAWMLKTDAARLNEPSASTPIVRLLPSFDTYLLGYHRRDLIVSLQDAKRINAGGGLLRPTLLADGRAVGTWKITRLKPHLEVHFELYAPLAPEVSAGVEAEISDLARSSKRPSCRV
jgi:hypothetical protein